MGNLTVAQAAEKAGMTRRGVNKAIERGKLRAEKFGDVWVIVAEDFDEWMDARNGDEQDEDADWDVLPGEQPWVALTTVPYDFYRGAIAVLEALCDYEGADGDGLELYMLKRVAAVRLMADGEPMSDEFRQWMEERDGDS